jgi:hypothetical protein
MPVVLGFPITGDFGDHGDYGDSPAWLIAEC